MHRNGSGVGDMSEVPWKQRLWLAKEQSSLVEELIRMCALPPAPLTKK